MDRNDDNFELKVILWLILFLVFGIIIITCKTPSRDYVMTVKGPEPAGKLGITLEHEHILVDFIGADSTGYFRWNRDSVLKKMIPIVLEAKERGLKTFIECTPAYLGRDPWLLMQLSEATGIIFVTNTGYYGALKNKYVPQSFFGQDAEAIAGLWIAEFNEGIEGSGVKPGFIKIAVENDSLISDDHKKIVKAAGIAHLKTGMPIASHTGPDHLAFGQISILEEIGVDPSAFIWVHANRGSMGAILDAAARGVWISIDNIRNRPNLEPGAQNSIAWYVDRIVSIKEKGFLNKLLLSHDSGWYEPGKPGGGNTSGFTDLFDYLIPELKNKGFTQADIDQILIKNPAEAFKIRKIH